MTNSNTNTINSRREKLFYIIMIIFYLAFPFAFFFEIFEHSSKRKTIDDEIIKITDKYSIVNLKDLSDFMLIVSILCMIISLTLAVFLIIDLVKNKYYRIHIKVLSGLTVVLLGGLIFSMSIYLGIIFFMAVCNNLFILSFDYRNNKYIKVNLLIYIPIYILFVIMLILSFGFVPMG